MDHFQYLLLLAGCLLITLPLEWLFRARVYRRPRRLLRALWPSVVLFMAWDILGIQRGWWSYNDRYILGPRLPFDVPVEELIFFVAIPICSLLGLGAVRHRIGR